MNVRKLLVVAMATAALLVGATSPALAVGKAMPKATGGVGYTAYTTTPRHAEFNAIETTTTCTSAWSVTGNYNVTYYLDGDVSHTAYTHNAALTQTGSAVTGAGGYPAGGPYVYAWSITGGSVAGSALNLTMDYTLGAPGTTMHMTGTIASNGTMSGTWDDNYGGPRTGTWMTTAGAAQKVYAGGCTGKGVFNYSDASGLYYTVKVQYVTVSGNTAWFAGPVVSGNVGADNWLFVKVVDGGEPAAGVDQAWGSFATMTAAKNGVATMANPADGPFTITSGNLQVH